MRAQPPWGFCHEFQDSHEAPEGCRCSRVGVANVGLLRGEPVQQDLSQEAFADACGLHRTYIRGIERGVRNPTVPILDKIAKAL